MAYSIFDLFKVGVGPSSSHTVGLMIANNRFIKLLTNSPILTQTFNIPVNLYGSLALTGIGHATNIACTLGLMSQTPDLVNPDKIPALLKNIKETNDQPLCRSKQCTRLA
jgi:L-serine dehydratase